MKIAEYNEMMAYLLRPAQEAKLVDDLEPGSLKDELLKDFDPSQETYEEYLQRKSMRETAAQGGIIQRKNFSENPLKNFDRMTRAPGEGIKKIKIEQVEENIKKITYLDKATGKKITIYKTLITDAPKKIDGKQIAGKGGDYKTLLSKEFSTLKEAQKARNDFRKKRPKNIPEKDPTKDYTAKEKRKTAERATSGRLINFKAPKGYVAHHMKPLAGRLDMTDADIAIVSQKMNSKMSKFDKPMNALVDESMTLDFNDTKSMKRLNEINEELAGYVKQAEKELPKKYKGLLGFNKLTPVLDTFDDKGQQVFSIEEVGTDYKKSISKKKKGTPLRDIRLTDIQKQVSEAPVLGSNLAFGKALGSALKYVPTPAATVGLSAGFGIDPESSLDRTILGTELAAAPALVKQSSRIASNPLLRRALNLGLSPQMAMRAARVASPIGIASLIGEGVYTLGKEALSEQDRIDVMSPDERDEYLDELESYGDFSA